MPREIRVNQYERNWQESPDVAVLANGDVVIVWDSFFNNYDDSDIELTYVAGRRYGADGTAVTDEFVVDAINYTSSEAASITALADGGYVVVWAWSDTGPILTSNEQIWGAVYNADGSVRTEAFRIARNGDREAINPEVVARGDGGFSVAWNQYDGADGFEETYIRHFGAAGTALGRAQGLNTNYDDFDQTVVESAQLADGRFVVIWNAEGGERVSPGAPDGTGNTLRGTIFNADGSVFREDFHLNHNIGNVGAAFGLQYGPGYDVVALNDGGFFTVNRIWDSQIGLPPTDDSLVMVTFFDRFGNAETGPIVPIAAQDLIRSATGVQLTSGIIVLGWTQQAPGSEVGDDVFLQFFTETGARISGPIDVSGRTDANFFDQTLEELVALPGGGLLSLLTSESIDNDDEGISATFFLGGGTDGDDVLRVDNTGFLAGMRGEDRLTGNNRANVLDGGGGRDRLIAKGGDDVLLGGSGGDRLIGGSGADILTGGAGADLLKGGSGADTFRFAALDDSRPGNSKRDVVADFRGGQGDRIDVSGIDALRGQPGDQAFSFIGTGGFSGAGAELRYVLQGNGNILVQGDVDGDGRAEFAVVLRNVSQVDSGDFIL